MVLGAPTAIIAGYSIKDQLLCWGLMMEVASVADVVLLLMLQQVMQDLLVDESTCTALVSYTLPQHTTKLSAGLTARLLLALPGTNGEPDYQDFDIQTLLPGHTCLQHRSVLCLDQLPAVGLNVLMPCTTVLLVQQLQGTCRKAFLSATPCCSCPCLWNLNNHRKGRMVQYHQWTPQQ